MKNKREKLTNKEVEKRLNYLFVEMRNIIINVEHTFNLFLHYLEFTGTGEKFKKYVDKIKEKNNGSKNGKQSLRDSSTKDRGSDKGKLQTKKRKLQTGTGDSKIENHSAAKP